MQDYMLFAALAALLGLGLLVTGLFRRASSAALSALPRRAPGRAAGGERAIIGGKAESPFPLVSPVTSSPCVFYSELVETLDTSYSSRGVSSGGRWRVAEHIAYGGFYVRDGAGAALVFPTPASLELSRPEFGDSGGVFAAVGDVRRTENLIQAGQPVTVAGTARPLAEFMAFMRAGGDVRLPADMVERLAAMERDPEACALPCYFGDGVEAVADAEPGDFLRGRASSDALLLQLGALLLAGGIAAAVYILKSGAQAPQP